MLRRRGWAAWALHTDQTALMTHTHWRGSEHVRSVAVATWLINSALKAGYRRASPIGAASARRTSAHRQTITVTTTKSTVKQQQNQAATATLPAQAIAKRRK